MARSDAAEALRASGLPVAYYRWPDGSDPTYPSITYVYDGDESFMADDGPYFKADRWRFNVESRWKDDGAELAVESALESRGIVPRKLGEEHDREAGVYRARYTFILPR